MTELFSKPNLFPPTDRVCGDQVNLHNLIGREGFDNQRLCSHISFKIIEFMSIQVLSFISIFERFSVFFYKLLVPSSSLLRFPNPLAIGSWLENLAISPPCFYIAGSIASSLAPQAVPKPLVRSEKNQLKI